MVGSSFENRIRLLVEAVPALRKPFLQAVTKLMVPKMHDGRVATLGYVAVVVPPPTGSGTSQSLWRHYFPSRSPAL